MYACGGGAYSVALQMEKKHTHITMVIDVVLLFFFCIDIRLGRAIWSLAYILNHHGKLILDTLWSLEAIHVSVQHSSQSQSRIFSRWFVCFICTMYISIQELWLYWKYNFQLKLPMPTQAIQPTRHYNTKKARAKCIEINTTLNLILFSCTVFKRDFSFHFQWKRSQENRHFNFTFVFKLCTKQKGFRQRRRRTHTASKIRLMHSKLN